MSDTLNRAKLITRYTGMSLNSAKTIVEFANSEQLAALDAAAIAKPPGPAVITAVDRIRAEIEADRKKGTAKQDA